MGVLDPIRDGGPILLLLGLLSCVSIFLILWKALHLAGALRGQDSRDAALAAWSKGERDAALTTVSSDGPVNSLLLHAMASLNEGVAQAPLEAELEWRGNREVAGLARHIRSLELIAMISPLLGLLGTVLGMIQSFRELAQAEGAANAALLASGIWQALLTTAAGLVVAIPAAVAAGLMTSRLDRITQEIETTLGRLFASEGR
ncbi:MotA/TolQ/ExbB proton channel family protein [Pseudooceanicola sp. C21-150M6]|uniref:MotA/TolQ/ExbB proton channel family protein n=1 Tax=Pseudooceanicola sp. C21-150M6 TaxID=3434355 RepID=UPI003D7F37AF